MKKNPLLDVAFSKKIWKVCLSHSALLLELRDVSFSPASYTAIDLKEKKILWQNQSFFSSPRIFLCDVKMNKAIFSSFAEENLPRTQGVIVMDINTTAINWQNELLCYLKGYDSHILVYALHDIHKKVFACELQTGTIVENSQSLAKSESLILSPKRYL
ncbi:MAG: DUF4905 domain-containing protein, partial [Flammeovirgaceae bacterium]|nr:DUF4905 domain-containing protein [Flammeovirgaceae bacterium]